MSDDELKNMKSAEDWLHTVRRFMNEDSLDTRM
jgi:hemolysin expression modulating protein